ncbi:MAG: SIS domain-containing protein [Candidatus Omnitrophota bacterium]
MSFFEDYLTRVNELIRDIDDRSLEVAVQKFKKTQKKGRKLIFVGNGGSAAIASHVAVDLTKTAGIRAINFNEADLLTCLSNDCGYEHWVQQALGYYADKGDLAVMISSSGKSKNILLGAAKALEMGLDVITFSGFKEDNPLRKMGSLNLWVNSKSYNFVEMAHHVWLLAIVDKLVADYPQKGAPV